MDGGSGVVFSIVERDDSEPGEEEDKGRFVWDVYHIENYLLEPAIVLDVLRRMTLEGTGFRDASEVEGAFRDIAKGQIDELVEHSVRKAAHEAIRRAIKLRGEDNGTTPAQRISRRLKASLERLTDLTKGQLHADQLTALADNRRQILEKAVAGDGWKTEFRGRDLLRQFTDQYTVGVRYEVVRDMIVNAMAEREIRPHGMLRVLEKIDKAVRPSPGPH